MKKKHTGNFFEKNMGKLLLLLLPFLILILSALSKYEAVLTEALFFVEMAFVLMLVFQVVSPVLGLLVLPFIPLYLIAPYTVWFYVVLFLYCGIFACIGRMKLYYRWTEIIISICFFLFFAIAMKSLIDYHVVDEKQVVKTAIQYGTLE